MCPAETAPAILTVDLDALARNYRRLVEKAKPAVVAAVVKADAYGLGLAEVATTLWEEGNRVFFVATLGEGVTLRCLLPEATIYVLEGLFDAPGAFVVHRLVPVLNTLEELALWRETAAATGRGPLPAALHVDTGMNRLGLSPAEGRRVSQDPSLTIGLELVLVMSHLACADEPHHPMNTEQLRHFTEVRAWFPHVKASLANSAAILLSPAYAFDLVRPGIALYGGHPFFDGTNAATNPMEPVVGVSARVLQVRNVDSPGTVGYGATARIEKPTRIATVAVGYGDGFQRTLSNRTIVTIDGIRTPLVGRVSMDMITLDVSAVPAEKCRPGSYVDLVGPFQSVDELAAAAGTISYELLTALGRRYARVYRRSARP